VKPVRKSPEEATGLTFSGESAARCRTAADAVNTASSRRPPACIAASAPRSTVDTITHKTRR